MELFLFLFVLIFGIYIFLGYGSKNNVKTWKKYSYKGNAIQYDKRYKNQYDRLLDTTQWKAKRKEILERDNYTCQHCGKNNCALQVHHKYYNKYPDNSKPPPWDYPNDALITLCDECHTKEHEQKIIKTYYRKYD